MRSAVAASLGLAAVLGDPTTARAEGRPGFAIARFEPAERGSRFLVVDSLAFDAGAPLRPAAGATLDWAYRPLVVEDAAGAPRFAPVRQQLIVHVGGSVAVGRVRLGLDLPFAVLQDGEPGIVSGERLRAATAPALGDVRVAADVRVIGRSGGAFGVAIGARAWAPTGVRGQFTSDGTFRVAPQVLASGDVGAFAWGARLSFAYRSLEAVYAGSAIGSELAGAVAAGLRLAARRLLVGPELWASSVVAGGRLLGARETPVNAVLGARYQAGDLHVGGGLGAGVLEGLGAPSARAILSVEWAPTPPAAPRDRDGDGIQDADDACPAARGVRSPDPLAHGCPPAPPVPAEDADGDGVSDTDDACPAVSGAKTNDPMTTGCPPSAAPRPLAVVTRSEIRIGERIRFATDSAELLADSDAVLGAVQRLLEEHPEIRKIRIEGHTDAAGTAAHNDELSARRASAVARWLVDRGIDPARLAAEGYGSRRPVEPNDTEAGRASNRRVVFTIVERDAAPAQ